ncbi:hypothetical protein G7046_g8890 [Stylonectria norvegica]|nr:hypothetical protein G7046_g8890 [Stylonectria norvegica]
MRTQNQVVALRFPGTRAISAALERCDRALPCSNCLSARVSCTHTNVAPRSTAPKQRVSISAGYETKLERIARDVRDIKSLLQARQLPDVTIRTATELTPQSNQDEPREPRREFHIPPLSDRVPRWDHSIHIIDFVKTVIAGKPSSTLSKEPSPVISSLRRLVDAVESNDTSCSLRSVRDGATKHAASSSMPPMESVVEILKWAKVHANHVRLSRICSILPLEKFEEICRKVYFAVDDYTEVDYILANGFLSHAFSEHVITSGSQTSRTHCQLCRFNLCTSISRLPMLLLPSMEVIAALTIASLYLVEYSKATSAWIFLSTALSHCQTLGYHHPSATRAGGASERAARESLFWAVYSFESGLALRLGRSSGIQDADIKLPIGPGAPRTVKLAQIQKKVYNELYGAASLALSAEQREHSVQCLSEDVRGLREGVRREIAEAAGQVGDEVLEKSDAMQIVYLYCDLVCESSLLVLILRATPTAKGSDISEQCVVAARDTLDIHQYCMELVRRCKDPMLITKYVTWAILHTPFVPFSIIFTRAIQLSDTEDLARLDAFASSLKPQKIDSESITHPFRLYELLCQAARLYIDSNAKSSGFDAGINPAGDTSSMLASLEHGSSATGTETYSDMLPDYDYSMSDLGDWYYSNQQLMGLLNEDVIL